MDVNTILKNIGQLGSGLDEPASNDLPIFEMYLNKAHNELFLLTAPKNHMVQKLKEEVDCVQGECAVLTSPYFLIVSAYLPSRNETLFRTDDDTIFNIDPTLQNSNGIPTHYYIDGGTIKVYPKYTGRVGIRYIRNPAKLVRGVLENQIPYPVPFHGLLVSGACYYLYQAEGAFRDQQKMNLAKTEWEEGKTKLLSFLTSRNKGNYYSTFSKV